jgi:alkylation response protein AidB-like acyl-CoA dehydrogenase
MRFEIGEAPAALRDAAVVLLDAEATPALVRAAWPGGDRGAVCTVWRRLAAVGVAGALVGEAAGGLGLDEDCLVPLLDRVGRSGLPVPAAETVAVAAPLLAAAGSAHLSSLLTGRVMVAAQLGGGDAELVPYGQHTELVLLRRGGVVRLYERDELALEPVATVDGARAVARPTRPATGGVPVAEDPAQVRAAWQRGVLGTAALLTGLATRVLEMTVDYVAARRQFGVPVGSFQAIKHALAAALLAVEFARPVVLAAGWALASGEPDAAVQVSMAKILAGDAALLAGRTGIQCHGAMAYTTEYDLHLFVKRIWALAPSWGDAAWHRARLATALGLEGA